MGLPERWRGVARPEARAALIHLHSLPISERPPDMRTTAQVMRALGITEPEYYGIIGAPDFADQVRDNIDHWKAQTHQVFSAVLLQATTPGPQQARFAAMFLAMTDHPAAPSVEALVEDAPSKRTRK